MDEVHKHLLSLCRLNRAEVIDEGPISRLGGAILELAQRYRCAELVAACNGFDDRAPIRQLVDECLLSTLSSKVIANHQQLALARAAGILAAAKIPIVVLKGHAIATMMFNGNATYKRMNDVDILVPEAAFIDAARLLQSGGFTTSFPPSRVHTHRLVHHYVPLVSEEGAHLDLHWNITGRHGYRVNPHDLFERSVPIHTAAGQLLRLSDVDFMNHLLIHYHFYRAKVTDTLDLTNCFDFFAARDPKFIEKLNETRARSQASSAHFRAANVARAVVPDCALAVYAKSLNSSWFWRRETTARLRDPQFIFEGRTNYFGALEACAVDCSRAKGAIRLANAWIFLTTLLFPSRAHLMALENRRSIGLSMHIRLLNLVRVFYYYRAVV